MKPQPIGLAAILWLSDITTACVDFSMDMQVGSVEGASVVRVNAALTDNGVQRCQIQDVQIESDPWALTPFAMHCHEGYWAGIAFIDVNNAVIRYTTRGFDGTFTVQSADYHPTPHAWWEYIIPLYNLITVVDRFEDDKKPHGPYFRKTEWGCDYGAITEHDGYNLQPGQLIYQDRLLAKKGWNRSGPEHWRPDTLYQ
jgi:hypothetical protein